MSTTADTTVPARTAYEPVIGLEVHVQLLTGVEDFLLLLHALWRRA
jgi:hypothetical protein